MIQVMIVDDQTLMRDGLKTILELEEDMEVVGVAANGKEAYELIDSTKPNIILMDIRMPVLNGVEATKMIKRDYKEIGIIILTTFDTDDLIIEALASGADGYMLKDIEGNRLVESIRDAYRGDTILPAKIAAKLVARLVKGESKKKEDTDKALNEFELTEREKDICQLLIEGLSNKQICEKVYLSTGTVKNYITSIYNKVGVSNRTAAVLLLKKLF
ncbi:response regulator [Clostridium sp.]|uniref:response regulator n=1 Tax=Clostridium sp. TaxID=1506 RepID=UPI003F40A5DD